MTGSNELIEKVGLSNNYGKFLLTRVSMYLEKLLMFKLLNDLGK